MVPLSAARRGGWALTRSGRRIYFLDPRPRDFCVADVARGLAVHPRWAGQTIEPYSVAQHSVLVAVLVLEEMPAAHPLVALRALFHDAPEAFLSDLMRPLKYELRRYRRIEQRMMAAICEAFGLPQDEPPALERAHERAQATERRDLYPAQERRMRVLGEPRPEQLRVWDWREAEAQFLSLYDRLEAQLSGRRREVARAFGEALSPGRVEGAAALAGRA